MSQSPARKQIPNKPLPPPPQRVAALSGRDAVLGSPLSGQRATKAHSVDADSESMLAARSEALIMHQRVGSDRSPRSFTPTPVRSDSSPALRGPRGGYQRPPRSLVTEDMTPEQLEEALLDELVDTLQDAESLAWIEIRINEASHRQGHQGKLRSGALDFGIRFHVGLLVSSPYVLSADNEAIRFEKHRAIS